MAIRLATWQKVALAAAVSFLGFKLLKSTLKWSLTAGAAFGVGFWLYLHFTDQEEEAKQRIRTGVTSGIFGRINGNAP